MSIAPEYSRYLFEYRHDGAHWGIEIMASSPDDARERLKAISWADYKGEIAATIPVPGGRMLDRIRTYLQGRK
jgi:hypothetical protein